MLRLPPFELHHPTTAQEAVRLRADLTSDYLAGGTDLLVNLKHRLRSPPHLISLAQVEALHGVTVYNDRYEIGSMTRLQQLLQHETLSSNTGFREAIEAIAGPQHRRMGTLGGNVLLDTRCLFLNQTLAWRTALGGCLKADGDWCHVIGSDRACVAAQSSDSVPMLTALGARLHFQTIDGPVERDLRSLFTKDGRYHQMLTVPRSALLESIVLPRPLASRTAYRKIRSRGAVDFAQASVAIAAEFDQGMATSLSIVVGAMLPAPRVLGKLNAACNTPWTPELMEHLADRVHSIARPQTTIHGGVDWRRTALRVETLRALRTL